jgi:hypothetical protein
MAWRNGWFDHGASANHGPDGAGERYPLGLTIGQQAQAALPTGNLLPDGTDRTRRLAWRIYGPCGGGPYLLVCDEGFEPALGSSASLTTHLPGWGRPLSCGLSFFGFFVSR